MAGEDIDTRSSSEEVEHHLPGDLLGIEAYPLGCHAMISSHGDDGLVPNLRPGIPRYPGDKNGKVFKLSQATLRLGKRILAPSGSLHCLQIQRLY